MVPPWLKNRVEGSPSPGLVGTSLPGKEQREGEDQRDQDRALGPCQVESRGLRKVGQSCQMVIISMWSWLQKKQKCLSDIVTRGLEC